MSMYKINSEAAAERINELSDTSDLSQEIKLIRSWIETAANNNQFQFAASLVGILTNTIKQDRANKIAGGQWLGREALRMLGTQLSEVMNEVFGDIDGFEDRFDSYSEKVMTRIVSARNPGFTAIESRDQR